MVHAADQAQRKHDGRLICNCRTQLLEPSETVAAPAIQRMVHSDQNVVEEILELLKVPFRHTAQVARFPVARRAFACQVGHTQKGCHGSVDMSAMAQTETFLHLFQETEEGGGRGTSVQSGRSRPVEQVEQIRNIPWRTCPVPQQP